MAIVLVQRHHGRHADGGHAREGARSLLEQRIERLRAIGVVACESGLEGGEEDSLGAEPGPTKLGLERPEQKDGDGQQHH